MKDDLLKILTNSNKDIDNQKLMNYVSKQSTDAERFEVEDTMTDSDFLSDAVEGLSTLNTNKALQLTDKLNNELQKTLRKKKKSRRIKNISVDPSIIFFAIILILILVIVGYILIRKHLPF